MTLPDLTACSALSVDLFDTLLLRAVDTPADVFLRVGEQARRKGLVRPHVTAEQFAALRRSAEDTARRNARARSGSSEVDLTSIYEALPAGTLAASPAALAQLELAVECDTVFPHPGTRNLIVQARRLGLPTALVSDTYFSATQIQALLRAAGLDPAFFDVVLTSSDAGVSKRDGGLFRELLRRWPDLAPEAIQHYGDHPHADVMRARDAGLRAHRHQTGELEMRETLRLESLRHGTPAAPLTSLRRLAVTHRAPADDDARWWFTLGASALGPLLSAFADWVVAECMRDGIRTVRPLMREGALLGTLIDRAADHAGVSLDVKPLFASRASTWLASVEPFGPAAARQLLQRQTLTVAEALSCLGLRAADATETLRLHAALRLDAAGRHAAPGGATIEQELLAYLDRADVRVEVDHHARRARRLLREFIDQECGRQGDVALVDLGFRGTTGRSIERAASHASRRLHQFLVFGSDTIDRLWREGCDVRIFGGGPGRDADLASQIARHPALLEALLMEGGTTLGYRRAGTTIVPILDCAHVSSRQQAEAHACRQGILDFQERWLDWRLLRSSDAGAVAAARRLLVAPLHRLLTMPTSEEAIRLGTFQHEDNDGGTSVRALADPTQVPPGTSVDTFLGSVIGTTHALGRTWLWPAGTCEQVWPGALERQWRQAAGAHDGAPPVIPAVAQRVRQAGVTRCIVWGAGEAGAALVSACKRVGIDVPVITDSNPALWGTSLDGIPVVSPEDAQGHGTHVYAIGSLAFAADIEHVLRRRYATGTASPLVFSPSVEAAA